MRGSNGVQFPGRQFTMGTLNHCRGAKLLMEVPKSPNNVTSTVFDTVNLPSKEVSFDHRGVSSTRGAPNLLFALGAIQPHYAPGLGYS